MSGHSKWSKIKHQKGANDAKRGVIFTKLGHNITLAAREGGGDLEMNFKLRMAVDAAKQENMPNDNIDRAIKRGTGELNDGTEIVEIAYEAYGPGGVPMIIDVATDNSNRAIADIRKAVSDAGGSIGDPGSVAWQFEQFGLITIRCATKVKSEKHGEDFILTEVDPEELTLEVMEIEGVLDIQEVDVLDPETEEKHKGLEIQTERNSLAQVHKALESKKYIVLGAEMIKIASNKQEVDEKTSEKVDKLIEALEELDDVQNVFDNRG